MTKYCTWFEKVDCTVHIENRLFLRVCDSSATFCTMHHNIDNLGVGK